MSKKHHPYKPDQYTNSVFVSTSGNDSTATRNDPSRTCLTITRAIQLALPGDSILVAAGSYDVHEVIDLPHFVSLKGAGLMNTFINSFIQLTNGAGIVPGNGSIIQGLTISGALRDHDYQAPIGCYRQKGFINAKVFQCRIVGGTDIFFFLNADVLKDITIDSCVGESFWDGLTMKDSNARIKLVNSTFKTIGPSPIDAGGPPPTHALMLQGQVDIRNCKIIAGGSPTANYGVFNDQYGAGATITGCGNSFDVSGANPIDVQVDPSSVVGNLKDLCV